MKNFLKTVGFIALAAVIGFSMAGCGDDGGGGGAPPGDSALEGEVYISPFVKVGVAVTAITDNLDGSGTISYTWMTDAAEDGAYTTTVGTDNASYTPVAADENKYLKVVVTRAGYSGSISSNAVEVKGSSATAPTVSSVSVTPDTATKDRGATQQFSAVVSGTGLEADPSYDDVIWTVSPQNPGTSISQDGLLTIGANEVDTTLTVKAASVLNPAQYDTATVTVTIPTGLIKVRITGIPVSIMQSAANYYGFAYGLFRGNELNIEDIYDNVLAYWDTNGSGASTDYNGTQTSGTFYYEFTFLDAAGFGTNYQGTARGYDIGIMDNFSGATWVLRNHSLTINTVNTIAYSAFTPVVGTFRIRVTGIPADVMASGTAGMDMAGIQLFEANILAPSSISLSEDLESLGGDKSDLYDPPYTTDTNYTGQPSGAYWVEFTVILHTYDRPYVGPAGNYDIAIFRALNDNPTLPSHWDFRAISNRRFEVNTVNTIAYNTFVAKTVTGDPGGGGGTDPGPGGPSGGTLTITGVPANLVSNVTSWGGGVEIFPTGTTIQQALSATTLHAWAAFQDGTVTATGSTYTVTVTLFNVSSLPWTGSGSYQVFVLIGASDTAGVAYGVNTSFSSGSANIAFSSFADLGPFSFY